MDETVIPVMETKTLDSFHCTANSAEKEKGKHFIHDVFARL
jgi:hypothetical protein